MSITISDRYKFDIDLLVEELRIMKLDKRNSVREKHHTSLVSIDTLNDINYISPSELEKILQHIKELKTSESLIDYLNEKVLINE